MLAHNTSQTSWHGRSESEFFGHQMKNFAVPKSNLSNMVTDHLRLLNRSSRITFLSPQGKVLLWTDLREMWRHFCWRDTMINLVLVLSLWMYECHKWDSVFYMDGLFFIYTLFYIVYFISIVPLLCLIICDTCACIISGLGIMYNYPSCLSEVSYRCTSIQYTTDCWWNNV